MANIDKEMSQFQKVTTLENKDYIVVSLDNGTQGQIKVSDLASVVAGVIGIDDIRNSLERQFKMLGTYYLEPGESMSFEAKGLVYIYNSYQSAEWYVLWVDNGAATIIKGISGIPFKATYSGGKVILENNMSNTRKYVIACQNLNLVE